MAFYPKYDYTIPEQAKENIQGEAHTVPSSPPFEIVLRHIPKQDDPSTVSIPGFSEVMSSPGAGEFRVHYGRDGLGRVEFSAADGGAEIAVSYIACGSVVWAEDYDGGNRQGINHLQATLAGSYLWKLAGFNEDATPNTPFGVTVQLDETFDVLRLIIMGENQTGDEFVKCRVNGQTGAVYSFNRYAYNDAVTRVVSSDGWDLVQVPADRNYFGEYIIQANVLSFGYDAALPAITGNGSCGTASNYYTMLDGVVTDTPFPITQIDVSSIANGVGRVAVYGFKFPTGA